VAPLAGPVSPRIDGRSRGLAEAFGISLYAQQLVDGRYGKQLELNERLEDGTAPS
jgi:hypothetical protein